ncbi:MAG: hypothetical protein NT150_03070 [Bacteroidetes bacterium]|nr:hypothetical protein [Bacteroidota bacterium]
MGDKTKLVLYCLFVGMLGLITRVFTDEASTINIVRSVVASLFIIAGIYYYCYQMFEREMNYRFSIRPFIRKGLMLGGLIGVFTGLSVILQFWLFGNEALESNLAIIHIDPKIKPEHLQEAIDGAYISNSWWALSIKQVLTSLAMGAFYAIIVAALFSFHPDRIREKK